MKWGISLSGGGVPGIAAHLGFMETLSEHGLVPPVLVGTSAGGLVAGMLAAGADLHQLITAWQQIADDHWYLIPREVLHAAEVLRPSRTPGFLSLSEFVSAVWGKVFPWANLTPEQLQQFALQEQKRLQVSGWRADYGVVVADLTVGKSLLLSNLSSTWPTLDALTATAATPILFEGVRGPDNHLCCDGGLYDLDPVEVCIGRGAVKVISVHIGHQASVPNRLSIQTLASIVISRGLAATNSAANPVPPDLAIRIDTYGGLVAFDRFRDDLQLGVTTATANLDKLRALVSDKP